MFWTGGVDLDLLSKMPDENTQILRLLHVIPTPDGAEELAMCEYLSGVLNQKDQELIFLRSQADLFSANLDYVSLEIGLEISHLDPLGLGW
jgi:hypothetical protein